MAWCHWQQTDLSLHLAAHPTHNYPCVQVFLESSMPVISHYERKGKVHRFYADRSPEDIYREVRQLFVPASVL